ncbi:MAG: hypothetical protein AAGA21_20670 [Pseudomonadota bacterium]
MLNAVRPFIDFYRVASFSTSSPPSSGFQGLWRGVERGWLAARRYRRLQLMSDRELAVLGLDRGSIGRHAFFGEPPFDRD